MTATLVTGADGYVGRLVTARLLDRGDDVVLAVRAGDEGELEAKRASLAPLLSGREGQAVIVPADLRDDEPFAAVDAATVDAVIHTAAAVRFNVERDVAQSVNVDGVVKLRDWVQRAGVEHVLLLSTLYTAGRADGEVAEVRHPGTSGFVNHYEWSKWQAEEAMLGEPLDASVAVARIGTVVADDASGVVTQFNAFHNTLRLFFYGLLSLVPGEAGTRVYLVTGDVVGDALAALAAQRAEGIFNVSHTAAQSCTLGELVDIAFDAFEREDDFRRRRILRPLFCDREAFDALVAGTRSLGASAMSQTLASVSPFAEQLYSDKDVRNDRLVAACPDITFPDPTELAVKVTTWLTTTRWGRNQVAHA